MYGIILAFDILQYFKFARKQNADGMIKCCYIFCSILNLQGNKTAYKEYRNGMKNAILIADRVRVCLQQNMQIHLGEFCKSLLLYQSQCTDIRMDGQ